MGQRFLLDTNTVIDYCGGKLPASAMLQMHLMVDAGFAISPVVKIEVLGFNGTTPDMQKLEGLLSLADMLYIDDDIIQSTIDLRKNKKMKIGDAIIAASALVHNLDLVTRNIKDFSNVPGLSVIDPYTL